jgi:MSHA pilin protein MshA
MKRSQGFTLIELIAVIAILAILAATAIPQFVDLRQSAQTAATNGVAGSLSSASSMVFARRVATNAGSQITACTQLISPDYVNGVTVTATATPAAGAFGVQGGALTSGLTGTCTLINGDNNAVTVTFQAIGS